MSDQARRASAVGKFQQVFLLLPEGPGTPHSLATLFGRHAGAQRRHQLIAPEGTRHEKVRRHRREHSTQKNFRLKSPGTLSARGAWIVGVPCHVRYRHPRCKERKDVRNGAA